MLRDNKYIREMPKIALFSVLGGIVMTYFSCGECRTLSQNYALVATFTALVWFVMWVGNGMLAEYIGCKISWVQNPLRRLIVGVISTLAYSVTAVTVMIFIFQEALNFNFGNYYVIIRYTVILTFLISLILHSREFLMNWRLSAINAEKFEKESIRAQYDSLRNQVNPHFLFNSLNALTNLVYENPDKAAKFIKQLSDVYRYVLDTRNLEVVDLEEELRFLRSYIFLQEIRFSQNFSVDIRLTALTTSVPPLALQLLVENAVKHNVITRDQPLVVKIYTENDFIVVENNLQKKSVPDETLSGLGLDNIRKRYSFLTNQEVTIEETADRFVVRLPILTITAA